MPDPTEPIRKAVMQGLALVVYQDADGVHIGVIDNVAIIEARAAGEDFTQGWLDSVGGSVEKLDSLSAFFVPWKTICKTLVDED